MPFDLPLARALARALALSLLAQLAVRTAAGAQTSPPRDTRESPRTTRAAVGGVVVDEHGRPLADAVVALPSLQRQAVTNESGRFQLRELPATTLVLEVRRLGYRSETRTVRLSAGELFALNVRVRRAAVTMDEVVVTGTATASDRRGAPDVAALGEAQLRATGTGSIGRTLERLPGVSNMTGGPAAGNPVLRGLSQGRVRIVRDGVPQESFEASPRWFPPGNLSSVDRIEVVRGPASILYGSSALGGAINVIPRAPPTSDAGGPRLSGLVESQYFSNNRERYEHVELAGASHGIGLRAGASRRVADDFRTPDAVPYAVSGRPGAPKFTGAVDFTNYRHASSYAQAGVAGGWGQVRASYDGWEGDNNFANANGKPVGVHARNDDVRVQGNVVGGTFILKPSVVLQRVGIRRAASVAKTFEAARDSNLWDQDLANRVVTARLEVEHPAVAGLRGTLGVESSDQRATTRLSQIQPSGSIRNVAAFALEQLRLGPLTLSAGGRLDARRQRAESSSLVDALAARGGDREAALDRRFAVFTGSVGASYQPFRPLTLVTSLGSGFRAPSFLDLYTNENRPSLGGWVEGNPAAKPERSTSVEAGARFASPRVVWGAVAYRNAFGNYTYLARSVRTRDLRGATLPVFATEQTAARLTGLELNATAELVRAIVGDVSYARIASRNRSTGEALPLMPADVGRASLRFAPHAVGRLRLPYAQIGVKHAWRKAIAGPTEPFADGGSQGFGVGSTPAYTLADVSVGGSTAVGASAVEVHLSVENLFATAYRDFLDTQKGFTLGPGRNVGVRVAVPLVLTR